MMAFAGLGALIGALPEGAGHVVRQQQAGGGADLNQIGPGDFEFAGVGSALGIFGAVSSIGKADSQQIVKQAGNLFEVQSAFGGDRQGGLGHSPW